MRGCGLGFRGGAISCFLVIFETVLSSIIRQLSLLCGSLEHVVGPLGAGAATPGTSTSAHSEGASVAWVHAPPTTSPIRPLHLSLTVTVIVLHRQRKLVQDED